MHDLSCAVRHFPVVYYEQNEQYHNNLADGMCLNPFLSLVLLCLLHYSLGPDVVEFLIYFSEHLVMGYVYIYNIFLAKNTKKRVYYTYLYGCS